MKLGVWVWAAVQCGDDGDEGRGRGIWGDERQVQKTEMAWLWRTNKV